MNYTAFFACFALAVSSQAFSAPAKQPANTWMQEPDSFLGLPLDSDLSDLPECQRGVVGFKQPVRCAARSSATYMQINPNPDIGLSYLYSVDAKLFDGKVQYLYMTGNTNDFEKIKSVFIQRYGKPHSDTTEQIKTRAGGTFENETLKWSGSRVSIVLSRYSDDINSYGASIRVNKVQEKVDQAEAAKSRGGASKL